MLKVNYASLRRGPLIQVHGVGQDPVAITCIRKFSWTSVAPEFQPWLGMHLARDRLWKAWVAQLTYCRWVWGMLQLDIFPVNWYMLLPYPVLVLVSCSSHLIQYFMILKAGVQGHIFAQASNSVSYTVTLFRHFWRDLKCHLTVCFWILHERLPICMLAF